MIGTCWRVAALGLCFCRGFGRRRGQQVTVVRTAETGGNDVATRQPKHKQAAKKTARQLRWDPGKQTQALSHSSHKGCRTGQGANRTGPWMLGAGCLVLGDGVGGERGGDGCCMQVQGCKRPNRLSAGEMPGSTERGETKTTQPNPASPCLVQSGADEGRKGGVGKVEVVCPAATIVYITMGRPCSGCTWRTLRHAHSQLLTDCTPVIDY